MADFESHLKDLHETIKLFHGERVNLLRAMQKHESNVFSIIMEVLRIVKECFDLKNQQIESLKQEIAFLNEQQLQSIMQELASLYDSGAI